jgi:hypothetical protein
MTTERKNGENAMSQMGPWPSENSEKRWLSYAELAERLGVCERTIRRDVDEGNLLKPIRIRGCVRFDWFEVVASLETRKES